jgi:hypothetical protein
VVAWSLGHGGTGPCAPTPSARPSAANTGARRCFLLPRQRIGSEVVARCLCSDKFKYDRGIYEIWLSLAIKMMALTPPNCTGAPVTRTGHALASEIDLIAGHTCVLARPASPWPPKNSGNWRCQVLWSVGCTSRGEVFWLIRDPKKIRRKKCSWASVCAGELALFFGIWSHSLLPLVCRFQPHSPTTSDPSRS